MTTRDEDVVQHMLMASTHDYVLFFTNKGRVFRLKTYEIPSVGLNAKGIAVVNLLQLQPEEVITSIIRVGAKEEGGFMFMCTKRGVVKKTPYEAYKNVRATGLITINIDEGDELRWMVDFNHVRPHDDHNLRSVYLHVLADAVTSVLAIAALGAGLSAGLPLAWFELSGLADDLREVSAHEP